MSNRYYVDSLAYDFDMFMPKQKKQNNIVELPAAKVTRKQSKAPRVRLAVSPVRIIVIMAMVAALAFTIYLRGEINSVSAQIAKAEKRLDLARSENISLEMELENCISYKNLEQSATELGMQKASRGQINYIVVNDSDVTQRVNQDGSYTVLSNE